MVFLVSSSGSSKSSMSSKPRSVSSSRSSSSARSVPISPEISKRPVVAAAEHNSTSTYATSSPSFHRSKQIHSKSPASVTTKPSPRPVAKPSPKSRQSSKLNSLSNGKATERQNFHKGGGSGGGIRTATAKKRGASPLSISSSEGELDEEPGKHPLPPLSLPPPPSQPSLLPHPPPGVDGGRGGIAGLDSLDLDVGDPLSPLKSSSDGEMMSPPTQPPPKEPAAPPPPPRPHEPSSVMVNSSHSRKRKDSDAESNATSSSKGSSSRKRKKKHRKSLEEEEETAEDQARPPQQTSLLNGDESKAAAKVDKFNVGGSNDIDDDSTSTNQEVDINYFPVQTDHNEYIKATEFSKEYVALLQDVQDRISNPQEGDNIQTVVGLIQKTGCFHIVNGSFTFDLCLLDKKTVKKIVKILGIPIPCVFCGG